MIFVIIKMKYLIRELFGFARRTMNPKNQDKNNRKGFHDRKFINRIKNALRFNQELKDGFQDLLKAFFELQKKYRVQIVISVLAVTALFGTWWYVIYISPSGASPETVTISLTSSADFNKSYRSDIDTSTVSGTMQLQTGGGAGSWWNTSYLYRKQLTVTNNSSGTIASNTLVKFAFDHAALTTD